MLLYTQEQLAAEHKKQLTALINKAGSYTFLAAMLDFPITTVQGWVSRGRISKAGAKAVEQHPVLGQHFKAVDLRPELQAESE